MFGNLEDVAREATPFDDEQRMVEDAKVILQEIILNRLLDAIQTQLTSHQKTICDLYFFQRMPMRKIAKMLNINYTAVPHAIHGIWRPERKRYYGGIDNKLKRYLAKDLQFQGLLEMRHRLIYKSDISLAQFIIDNEEEMETYLYD